MRIFQKHWREVKEVWKGNYKHNIVGYVKVDKAFTYSNLDDGELEEWIRWTDNSRNNKTYNRAWYCSNNNINRDKPPEKAKKVSLTKI